MQPDQFIPVLNAWIKRLAEIQSEMVRVRTSLMDSEAVPPKTTTARWWEVLRDAILESKPSEPRSELINRTIILRGERGGTIPRNARKIVQDLIRDNPQLFDDTNSLD